MAQLSRSQESLMQVRLDPKSKYFAVLLSKHAGLTLSEFVANCVEAVLDGTCVTVAGQELSYAQLQDKLWAEHPADRLAMLASNFPAEMTLRERILWQSVICRSAEFWHVPVTRARMAVTDKTFRFERLRKRWAELEELDREAVAALAQKIRAEQDTSFDASLSTEQKAFRESIQRSLHTGMKASKLQFQRELDAARTAPKPAKKRK